MRDYNGVDLRNGILPSHTKIDIWEEYARQVLLWFEPSTYSSLVLADKPDLVDTFSSLGVEVTRSFPEGSEEINAVYTRYCIEADPKRRKRFLERLSQLGAQVNKYMCLHPTGRDDFSLILSSHEKKLLLLNQKGYKVFDHNHLFIMSDILANKAMLKDALLRFGKTAAGYEVSLERVIVVVPAYVYEFNLCENSYSFVELNNSKQCELAMKARESVLEAEQISNR